jgi:hypothetical protein
MYLESLMEIMVEWLDDYHEGVKVKMYVIVKGIAI